MILVSFCIFLILISLVGISASRLNKGNNQDYILASRSVGPVATALSAVSTCHSGFMFIGMIGFTYVAGVSAIWLIIAWLIGDLFAWTFVYPKLRKSSEEINQITIAGFITHTFSKPYVKKTISILVLIFLSVYAAAQLTAGSKALWIMLEWKHSFGIFIGAIIVVLYSFSGGIRASIWTDVVQSIIMFCSMIGLCSVAILKIGGIFTVFDRLKQIDPNLIQLIPTNLDFGFPLYLLAWIAFGVGVIGQPHIISRPMAIKSTANLKKAAYIYLLWYLIFSLGSILVGLTARILLPELITGDTELALPILAEQLLPSIFVGGILAGIFSATISTADSQIIACSSSITQDLFPSLKNNYKAIKLSTLVIMAIAVLIALFGSQSVYGLVIIGWSVFAALLAPLVFLRCINATLTQKRVSYMLAGSFITVVIWNHVLSLSNAINESLPGLLIAFLIYFVFFIIKKK